MANKIIKPGKWWIVRFRRMATPERITGYLTCKNDYIASHDGFDRKWSWTLKARHWYLKGWNYGRLAYRFAELSDLKTTLRNGQITDWIIDNDGFFEVVEVEGCLYYHTITSEVVIDRVFNQGTNEMEILAIEFALGG